MVLHSIFKITIMQQNLAVDFIFTPPSHIQRINLCDTMFAVYFATLSFILIAVLSHSEWFPWLTVLIKWEKRYIFLLQCVWNWGVQRIRNVNHRHVYQQAELDGENMWQKIYDLSNPPGIGVRQALCKAYTIAALGLAMEERSKLTKWAVRTVILQSSSTTQ